MARKVILDVDPGIDDAMALCLALSDPELEVVAVTAVGGNVSPAQATRNVQAIIERLDPPRWPRLGAASEPDLRLAVDRRNLYGSDGLGRNRFRRGRAATSAALREGDLRSGSRCPPFRDDHRPRPIDEHRPGVHPRSGTTHAGRPHRHHGRNGRGPGQHHPGRRVQHVLRSGRGPGGLSFPLHQNPHPAGRDQSDRAELRSVQHAARRIEQDRPAVASAVAGGLPRLSPTVRAGGNPRPRHGNADGRSLPRPVHHEVDGRRRGDSGRIDRWAPPSSTAAASPPGVTTWKWPSTCRRTP